jgi:hypothetical protein
MTLLKYSKVTFNYISTTHFTLFFSGELCDILVQVLIGLIRYDNGYVPVG